MVLTTHLFLIVPLALVLAYALAVLVPAYGLTALSRIRPKSSKFRRLTKMLWSPFAATVVTAVLDDPGAEVVEAVAVTVHVIMLAAILLTGPSRYVFQYDNCLA